jgi:hypothetical protein
MYAVYGWVLTSAGGHQVRLRSAEYVLADALAADASKRHFVAAYPNASAAVRPANATAQRSLVETAAPTSTAKQADDGLMVRPSHT